MAPAIETGVRGGEAGGSAHLKHRRAGRLRKGDNFWGQLPENLGFLILLCPCAVRGYNGAE